MEQNKTNRKIMNYVLESKVKIRQEVMNDGKDSLR